MKRRSFFAALLAAPAIAKETTKRFPAGKANKVNPADHRHPPREGSATTIARTDHQHYIASAPANPPAFSFSGDSTIGIFNAQSKDIEVNVGGMPRFIRTF